MGLNALFLDPGQSGGTETYLRGLAPALAREYPATRFTVVTTRRGAVALRDDGWTDFCSLLAMPADEGQRLRRLAVEQVSLPVLAHRRGWDVIHSLGSLAPIRTMTPSVITLHDVTFFRVKTFGWTTSLAMRQTVGRSAHHADVLISGAAAARDEACETLGLAPERFEIVPHGAGRQPATVPLPAQDLRALHRIAPDARVLLCVAALRPHKNQALLVRALQSSAPDVHLVLCGREEPYANEVRALAADLGLSHRVLVMGYVGDAELEGLWRLASCAVFPTRGEGFGLPVIEAMQRGLAVACSDLPVLREVAGELGHYFPPDDPQAAARAIAAAMADHEAAARGPAHAAQFSWAAAAHGTFAAYERALAARN